MSSRPIEQKRRKRAAKAVRRRPLEASLDLIQWLKDRRYAQTTGEAKKIILAKRVTADSHTLGVQTRPVLQADGVTIKDEDFVSPYVPSKLRTRIAVKSK